MVDLLVLAIRHQGSKDYLFFNSDGAIGDKDQDFGLPGQVITSRGPNQPWEWGIGAVEEAAGFQR